MKKMISIIIVAILVTVLPVTAFAASVVLNNYYYTHNNTPGVFTFADKNGVQVQWGDGIEYDAEIRSINVYARGMASGDTITAYSSGGSSWPVNVNGTTTFSIPANQALTIKLSKSGTNEVYARLEVMRTFDADDGGTNVTYIYSLNDIPTEYGDLGDGSAAVANIPGDHYYFAPRDAYKYDYTAPDGATRYELHFLDSSGNTLYKRDYEQPPSGVHYLTCNGTYEMRFYGAGGQLIGKSNHMETTDIVSPSCSSFAGTGAGFNDMPTTAVKGCEDSSISWQPLEDADKYEIYRNGDKIGETTGTTYTIPSDGAAYTIVAKDNTNEVIGQTDIPSGSMSNGCQLLMEMLNCPGWDQYMGDLTGAIKAAMPEPPNWDLIADKIGTATVEHLADYMGEVPAVPTVGEIEDNTDVPLPPINTSAPDAEGLVPSLPPDFNSPIPFDLSDAPEIEIVDESEPFVIGDPLDAFEHDEPNVPVIPGDPGNHSDGIDAPAAPPTAGINPAPEVEIPVPSGPAGEDPEPIPSMEIPEPSQVPGSVPSPGTVESEIPLYVFPGEGGAP